MKKVPVKPGKTISLKKAIEGIEKVAQRKAFKKGLPVAISKNGKIYLLYPDKHTELLTGKYLKELQFKQAS